MASRALGFWVSHVPKLTLIVAMFLRLLPLPFPGFANFAPMWDAMCIFFWVLHAPRLLPLWYVTIIALLSDAIAGIPLGITAISHTILYVVMLQMRSVVRTRSLERQWAVWGGMSVLVVVSSMLLFSFHYSAWVGAFTVPFMQAVLSALLYPAFYALLHPCYRLLPSGWSHVE